jgi:hypothetical protein
MPALEPTHGGALAIIAYRMAKGDTEEQAKDAALAYTWPEETELPQDMVDILAALNPA